MNNENIEKKPLSTKQFLYVCLGIVLICLSVISATNHTFMGTFFTYIFSFLFGFFYPVVLFGILLLGFRFIINRTGIPFKKYFLIILFSFLLFLSILAFCSFSLYLNNQDAGMSTIISSFMNNMHSFASTTFNVDNIGALGSLGGGAIGISLLAALGTIWGSIGNGLFFGALMAFSLFIIIYFPLKKNLAIKKEKKIANQYKSPYQNSPSNSTMETYVQPQPTNVVDPSLVAPLTSSFGRTQSSFTSSKVEPTPTFMSQTIIEKQAAIASKPVNQEPQSQASSYSEKTPVYEPDTPPIIHRSSFTSSDVNPVEQQRVNNSSFASSNNSSSFKQTVPPEPVKKPDYNSLYQEELNKSANNSQPVREDTFPAKPIQIIKEPDHNSQASFSSSIPQRTAYDEKPVVESKPAFKPDYMNTVSDQAPSYQRNQQPVPPVVTKAYDEVVSRPVYQQQPAVNREATKPQSAFTSSSDSNSSDKHFNLSEEEKNQLLRRAQAFKDASLRPDNNTFDLAPDPLEAADNEPVVDAKAAYSKAPISHTHINPLEAQAKKAKSIPEKQIGPAEFKVELDTPKEEEPPVVQEDTEEILEQRYFEIKRQKKEEEQARIQAERDAKKAEVFKYVSNKPRIYDYPLPDDNLLEDKDDSQKLIINSEAAQEKAKIINNFFDDFKIQAKAVSYTIGASVTRFNIQTEPGVRSEKIASLANDLQIALNGDKSVRIETVVEGRSTSGIEIGNAAPMAVPFKEVFIEIEKNTKDNLLLPIGKDISGKIVTFPLNDMPHLLVAGTTGSGKSVLVHSMIMTLIMRNYPSQMKLMLIDPKQVEFAKYNLEPHLYCPVVSEPDKAIIALGKLCEEMDRRYKVLSKWQCVKISEYLEKRVGREDVMEEMPNVVCVIDEFADLMQTGGDEVASYVQRLTQKARAAGIYLIIATQRPSKDVIPMTIKGNISCRIGLCCSTGVDSRVILDENGAETLLGKGDLLFKAPGRKSLIRAQSPFISNEDIDKVLQYVHEKAGDPNYDPEFLDLEVKDDDDPTVGKAMTFDDMYEEIKDFVMKTGIVSKSTIMRNFSISYSKSDQVLARLRSEGIIQSIQGGKNIVVQRRPMEE